MIHADDIRVDVSAYLDRYPNDATRLESLTDALTRLDGDLTDRSTLPGHVTCSAVVVDPRRRVLHIRHNVLGTWLRPGGHLEAADTTLAGAASREVREETGIHTKDLELLSPVPVDVDVHLIPANPDKGELAHHHYDLRYLYRTRTGALTVVLDPDEVSGHRWMPVGNVQPAHLPTRVAQQLA
ncbi:NUDIX hydrolase [Cryptosporangium aurantiacum]|uniref:ADP-ribose pyrophosphatase YjhB, NUDIX family n=1 Tax=Cryptosporangium aurantiacum TaxID=134849 RepID=A0A1M7TYL5_9ACTN|nr:NUDIX domain-containing protein [Cryptosporangium aurantiacum]SHN75819.1 ADP-ribose pyrophosphatase YjhB, NUDIX family [Cryptosporangium aurantiacum]